MALDDTSIPELRLPASLAPTLRAGHPWIYRNHVPPSFRERAGWVALSAGDFRAYAIWDPDSALALRIFSARLPDAKWFHARIREAWELRELVRSDGTDAYRLVSGEGDRLPGIVVDLYRDFAVIVLDSSVLEPLLPWVVDGLRGSVKLRGVVLKSRDAAKLEVLWGKPPPARLSVKENGLVFLVNLEAGQKTGLFLDHRDNRAFIERLAAGKRVLNLFAYSGGFSLYAARGGATQVVSVDVAASALDDARENFKRNGLDHDAHSFVTADVFEYLPGVAKRSEHFDLVVVDPPSLARRSEQVSQARRAYVRLNRLALGVVADGGVLATASCTARIDPEEFRRIIVEAAERARRSFQLFHSAGHAADHPICIGHAEGRYLKLLVGRVLSRA